MAKLTVGPAGDFVYRPSDPDETALAEAAGLTLSTTASRPGAPVYFTRDPYGVVWAWPHADDGARARLIDLRLEYEASFAIEGSGARLSVPPDRELFPFQRAGVEYAMSRQHALIGDQPGLGKTAQAIVVGNEMRARRTLVICPANVRRHWRREILGWSTLPRATPYLIEKGSDGVSPNATHLITSYDLARTSAVHAALRALRFDLLVLDEAHYLKTTDAQRTRAIFGGGEGDFSAEYVAKHAEKVVALTGTPLPNRPRECYTLARALCWDALDWMSEDAFRHRFNPSFRWPSGRVEERVGRLPELQARLRCNFMVRRMKHEVLTQLPDKTFELAFVEPDKEVRRVLQAEKAAGLHSMPLDDVFRLLGTDHKFGGEVSTIRREMGEAMAPLAVDHVAFLLDGGVDKLIVGYWHRSVGDTLAEGLRRFGCVRVDGATSPVQRELRKREFQTDPSVRVFLGQMMAAGIGIDGLQDAASTAVLAEPDWVFGNNEQFIDRLHRIGQKDSVLAQFLVAPGSFAEKVLSDAVAKAHDVHNALDKRY